MVPSRQKCPVLGSPDKRDKGVILFLLWHESLCDLVVDETNRCGRSKSNWLIIDRDELLTFLGLIIKETS